MRRGTAVSADILPMADSLETCILLRTQRIHTWLYAGEVETELSNCSDTTVRLPDDE